MTNRTWMMAATIHPTLHRIAVTVAAACEQPVSVMTGKRHYREQARARQIAMTLAYRLTGASQPAIGRFFGGKDHTTVLHGIRTVERLEAESPEFRRSLAEITAELTRPAAQIVPPPIVAVNAAPIDRFAGSIDPR